MVVRRSNTYSRLSKKAVDIVPVLEDEAYDGLLSPEERAELLKEVEAEIRAEEIKQAKVAFKAKARTAVRIQKGLEEEQVTLLMDLAGHSDRLRIDNQWYYHGHTYTVPQSVADTLFYMMDQGWRHEESTGGANKDAYHKPRNTGLSMRTGMVVNPPVQTAESISPMSAGRVVPKITTSQNIGARQQI